MILKRFVQLLKRDNLYFISKPYTYGLSGRSRFYLYKMRENQEHAESLDYN